MGPAEGRRAWLTFDGLFYQGDVWLDGSYLGDTEGYFVPHTFEVTDALRARGEHHLAIEVTCARPHDLTAKRNLTGVFQHWDCLDPDWNPGGIWRPVRVDGDRPGAHRPPAGAVPRGHSGAGGAGAAAPPSTAMRPGRCRCTRTARRARATSPTSPSPPGDNDLEWTMTIDRPEPVVAPRARRRRPCTTSTSRCGSTPRRAAPVRRPPPAHRAAPGAAAFVDR